MIKRLYEHKMKIETKFVTFKEKYQHPLIQTNFVSTYFL